MEMTEQERAKLIARVQDRDFDLMRLRAWERARRHERVQWWKETALWAAGLLVLAAAMVEVWIWQ